MFAYIDWMSQQVVGVYEDERERWLENQNSLRALRVREILAANKTIDVDAATTSIRYPLRWHHLGLVMWYPDAGRRRRRACPAATVSPRPGRSRRRGRQPALRCRRPKLRMGLAAVSRRDCRCRGQGPRVRADVDRIRRVWQSGTMAGGVEGFRQLTPGGGERPRRRDRQRAAIRRADGDRGDRSGVVGGGAALAADVVDTRDWVATVLGDLATDDENDARLRETLRVYLALRLQLQGGRRGTQLALQLGEVSRGPCRRPARPRDRQCHGGDRLDVELALLVCHWYGSAVLQQKTR